MFFLWMSRFLWTKTGTKNNIYFQRSALAYRNDSSYEGNLNRINVGISTSSTTSHSTSKNSGGLFKGEDYLRSTISSTSGHPPGSLYPNKKTALTPYAYDSQAYMEKRPEGETLWLWWWSLFVVVLALCFVFPNIFMDRKYFVYFKGSWIVFE